MTQAQKCNLRLKILQAAHAAGIENANQFGVLAAKLGLCKSHARGYYSGQNDMAGRRLDILLQHFELKIGKRD